MALLLLLPVVGASWSGHGWTEPDTPHDVQDGYMWKDAPEEGAGAGGRVYFNVVALAGHGAHGVHPNVQGARLAPVGPFHARGLLGIWVDCNDDGYIGAAQGALMQYRSELLPSAARCPVGSAHRTADGWVLEFTWIQPPSNRRAGEGATPPLVRYDPEARVWGDFGQPGAEAAFSCLGTQLGAGTLARSGGVLRLADCALGFMLTGALHALDESNALGLHFEDRYRPDQDCGHPLNRPLMLYHDPNACPGDRAGLMELDAPPAFSVWDCTAGTRIGNPTGIHRIPSPVANSLVTHEGEILVGDSDGTFLVVPAASPGIDVDGSVLSGTRSTYLTTTEGCPGNPPHGWWPSGIQFAYLLSTRRVATHTSDIGLATSLVEGPGDPPSPTTGKVHPDLRFIHRDGGDVWVRSRTNVIDSQAGSPVFASVLGSTSQTLGLTASDDLYGSGWKVERSLQEKQHTHHARLVKHDLQPSGPVWATFYASVGTATVEAATLPGVAGTYGSDVCGAAHSGIIKGWRCDPNDWWRSDLGAPSRHDGDATLGARYHLRDVDCYDGHLAAGVRASLADLSAEGACPTVDASA